MTHAFFGEPRMPRLSKLLREIKQGEILIPRFQRPFVWDVDKRLALVGSVYSGYPIGAILVWRTQKHNLSTYENLGPLRMPQATDPSVVRQYLLDGHQRITTLFAALGPALFDSDEGDSFKWLDDADWPIYFDLESNDKEPFLLCPARQEPKSNWLPLDILLDPFKVNDFALALQKAGYDRKMVNRAHSIAEKFRDYEIPVMPVATEDLEQVTVSFKRVNSGGSKMSEVHMIHALSYARGFDLLKKLGKVQKSLKPVGWEHFNEQMILNVCKAELNSENPEIVAQQLAQQPGILRNARDAIVRVAGLLARFGVKTPKSLPYSYQAVLLADALRNVKTITDELEPKLYKWFWATTLTEYFRGMRGMTNSLFKRARLHLRDLVAKKSDVLSEDMRKIIVLPSPPRFDFRHARCKGVGLLLAEQKPRALDLVNAQPIDGFGLLGLHGVDALSKLVKESELDPQNRFRADGPENRFLIEPQQSGALQSLRAALMPFPKDTLMSHAIEEDTMDALRFGDLRRGLNEFLASRARTIESLEKSRAEVCGLEYRTTSELNQTNGLFLL